MDRERNSRRVCDSGLLAPDIVSAPEPSLAYPPVAPVLSFARLLLRISALLAPYFLLERVFVHAARLPSEGYEQAFLTAEWMRRLGASSPWALALVLLVASAAAAGLRYRSFGPRWSDLEHGTRLRIFIVLVAGVMTWTFGTYAYNLYVDRGHELDRLLLLMLLLLLWWRPVFVFPLLLLLVLLLHQFSHPLGGYSWAQPVLLLRVLVLFAALLLVQMAWRRPHVAEFVFLACCLVASHYWVPGTGKLRLSWVLWDRIYYLLPATHANGWLAFMDADAVSALTRGLAWFNWPMKLGTLLVECGALCCLWRRAVLRTFLVAAILLHVGILGLTGICFWQWVVLDAALLLAFFAGRSGGVPIFTPGHFLLSIVLIGGSAYWFRPARLAWHDVPASYTYRFEGRADSGRSYALPPLFFAPYEYQFTLSAFGYLTPERRLPIVWGASSWQTAAALERAGSTEEVLAVEHALGRNTFDPERRETFERFMARFVANWNMHRGERRWWRWLPAPPQLWTFTGSGIRAGAEPITSVRIYEVFTFFDGTQYREIRKALVGEVHTSSVEESIPLAGDGELAHIAPAEPRVAVPRNHPVGGVTNGSGHEQ